MNRRFNPIPTFLAVSLIGIFAAAPSIADDAELESVRDAITGRFESIDRDSVKPGPVDGWYMIQQGAIIAYVSSDARYLLQGDIIDLESRANLTEVARNDNRRELMAALDDSDVIAFSPEEVKHTVTVFTDIDCTFCRRLHAQIDEYMEAGIEVRYLLYPRNGPASSSWSTSEDVWCSTDRNGALTAAKSDQDFETQACDSTPVQNHYVLGKEVGLSGTPAIVLEDGTLIGGYLPPAQLLTRLNRNANPAQPTGDAGN